MYDIRQFKPALYFLLMLGVSGFAIAAEWPGLWVLAAGGVLLNAWLVKTHRFTPMPRLLASVVTIIAFLYIADLVIHSATTPILIIGQFLVLLQLVKLYEQRANRDYAQLIVLSLLLMVAAAINTASLIFGLMFIGYLFLSLYVCLLFHLKVESEDARKAIALPDIEPNPETLRQDQRFLSSSMRRLTGLISFVAVVAAVLVFLFFPRGTGANLLGPQFSPARAMTGFSEQVAFQQVAKITKSFDKVAELQVWCDGKAVPGTKTIYLRGLTLNYYTGPGSSAWLGERRLGRPPYHWMRSSTTSQSDEVGRDGDEVTLGDQRVTGPVWKQHVTLEPTGSAVLFAMAGPIKFRPARHLSYIYSSYDDYLTTKEPGPTLVYDVVSTMRMPYHPPERDNFGQRFGRRFGGGYEYTGFRPSVIDPKISEYVRRPEVSGRAPDGTPLVVLRDAIVQKENARLAEIAAGQDREFDDSVAPFTKYDEQIARNVENYLRGTFTYTLNLTDANRIEGQDPMVAFLYDLKRGHCEYFAGAMTLMLQSLQMPARMVVGFRCDEYNRVGGWYTVTQNLAHTWVEARGGWNDQLDGSQAGEWLTYDPTSGREAVPQLSDSAWSRVRNIFDYFEHTWATSVIAYDRGSRDNLVQVVDTKMTSAAISSMQQMLDLPNFLKADNWEISIGVLTVLITLASLALVVALAWFTWERYRMWRRAERIGIESLPSEERLRLARQLGFYDDLLQLLERRGINRPQHLTPMEFTDSLSFLPADAYHSIRRLTEVFYRIRYGRQQLSTGQRDRLQGVIAGVERILSPSTTNPI